MGSKWNGLNRNNTPNIYSMKKIDSLNAELPERIKLIARCSGTPRFRNESVKHNSGATYIIRRVYCIGGVCEICGLPARNGEILEPHEFPKRSAGAKVSLSQSLMCHRICHMKEHSQPQLTWII